MVNLRHDTVESLPFGALLDSAWEAGMRPDSGGLCVQYYKAIRRSRVQERDVADIEWVWLILRGLRKHSETLYFTKGCLVGGWHKWLTSHDLGSRRYRGKMARDNAEHMQRLMDNVRFSWRKKDAFVMEKMQMTVQEVESVNVALTKMGGLDDSQGSEEPLPLGDADSVGSLSDTPPATLKRRATAASTLKKKPSCASVAAASSCQQPVASEPLPKRRLRRKTSSEQAPELADEPEPTQQAPELADEPEPTQQEHLVEAVPATGIKRPRVRRGRRLGLLQQLATRKARSRTQRQARQDRQLPPPSPPALQATPALADVCVADYAHELAVLQRCTSVLDSFADFDVDSDSDGDVGTEASQDTLPLPGDVDGWGDRDGAEAERPPRAVEAPAKPADACAPALTVGTPAVAIASGAVAAGRALAANAAGAASALAATTAARSCAAANPAIASGATASSAAAGCAAAEWDMLNNVAYIILTNGERLEAVDVYPAADGSCEALFKSELESWCLPVKDLLWSSLQDKKSPAKQKNSKSSQLIFRRRIGHGGTATVVMQLGSIKVQVLQVSLGDLQKNEDAATEIAELLNKENYETDNVKCRDFQSKVRSKARELRTNLAPKDTPPDPVGAAAPAQQGGGLTEAATPVAAMPAAAGTPAAATLAAATSATWTPAAAPGTPTAAQGTPTTATGTLTAAAATGTPVAAPGTPMAAQGTPTTATGMLTAATSMLTAAAPMAATGTPTGAPGTPKATQGTPTEATNMMTAATGMLTTADTLADIEDLC